MPLPTIETPTYELKLPSSNKRVKYRPFLVKEEKILIIALESKSENEITNAVTDVLKKCILTKGVDVDNLPTFDIEYLFLNIRNKSVGETVEVNIICPDDNKTSVPVKIDIDSIKVKKDKKHRSTIKLDDDLSLKLKYPSLEQFIDSNFEVGADKTNIAGTLSMITKSIEMIYNEEESWNASDSTQKELEDFVDQLNTKQFTAIETFFATMPKLSHSVKVTNPITKTESTVVLEGLAAFFS